MKSISKWFGGLAVIVLLASTATSAEMIAVGKVKSVNADKKEFVLTDAANKDWTIKLGDNVVVNAGGKEGKSDLKAGDAVQVLYDKGVATWTAEYVLVQEGDTKNEWLEFGTFKGYDGDKKQFTFTDGNGKDETFALSGAKARMSQGNGKLEDFKIEDAKIGDKVLAIVDRTGDKSTLKSVIIRRK